MERRKPQLKENSVCSVYSKGTVKCYVRLPESPVRKTSIYQKTATDELWKFIVFSYSMYTSKFDPQLHLKTQCIITQLLGRTTF
jgi:hypothetical protein